MNRQLASARIFGVLSASILIYGLLAFVIEHNNAPRRINAAVLTQMRPVFVGLAVVALVASVLWLRFRVDGKIGGAEHDLMSPPRFQTESIIALALSELCTTCGLTLFFIGAPLREFACFAAGSLFINFAFIWPRGALFWNAHENRSSR